MFGAGTSAGGAFHPRDKLSVGDVLMSTINREMMRITADTPEIKGMHDVHGRMCNRALYEALGQGPKDGCHENPGQGEGHQEKNGSDHWVSAHTGIEEYVLLPQR